MITQILERLFLGGLQDAERLSRDNPNQISTVITLCEQSVGHKAANVHYVHLPVENDEPIPVRQFNAVMDAITKSICTGNVLVHCAIGCSRSPALTAAYLHRTGYQNFAAAIAKIKMLRPSVDPSTILASSVKGIL
jgi:protein-tyrosine phosphatase